MGFYVIRCDGSKCRVEFYSLVWSSRDAMQYLLCSSLLDGLVCGGVVVSRPGVWGDTYLDDGRWKDFPGIVGDGRLLVGSIL